MGSRNRGNGNYTNPCITMHQPWASLLVHGIKRIEGRSWPSPIRGRYRLWIHAAGKVPDAATIKAMEDFYREIYALDGVTDLKFPEHYPISRLIGCVDVVGCLTCEELVCWEDVPQGVRLEGLTNYCWLCEQPQKLMVPFEMRGYQGVYNLEKKIYEAAVGGLRPIKPPLTVKFPLPNPQDPLSLKPGSLLSQFNHSNRSEPEKSPRLAAVIAGARTASTQFSRKNNDQSTPIQESNTTSTQFDDQSTPIHKSDNASTQFSRKNGGQSTPIQESNNTSMQFFRKNNDQSTPIQESNNKPISARTRNKTKEEIPRVDSELGGVSSRSTQRIRAQVWVRKA